jgi:hypothetical protein
MKEEKHKIKANNRSTDQESDSVGAVKEDIKKAKKSKHTGSFQLNLSPKQVSH